MMHLKKLKKSRYDPKNLEVLEAKRWKHICDYQKVMAGPWKKLFKDIPASGYFYGHYKDRLVCFEYNGVGISESYPTESRNSIKFVQCLPDEELPLYINSTLEVVKNAVANRLRGDKDFEQLPLREDLVALYFKTNKRIHRLLMANEYYLSIILNQFDEMSEKIPKKPYHDPPMITILINKRVYIAKGEKFIIKPEDENHIVTARDCCKKDLYIPLLKLRKLSAIRFNGTNITSVYDEFL